VVGYAYTSGGDAAHHAFLYSDGVMYDLNNLIPTGSGWELLAASGINDAGQIAGWGRHSGGTRAFLLTPVIPYKAFVQLPINADGSSVFKAQKGRTN
jgi:probable HAF family extracellular repeat protein